MNKIAIVGAGLAGCECALTLAAAGIPTTIYEQKPLFRSPAHASELFAELVCSNSLRSDDTTSAIGLLKQEMRSLNSPFMEAADACRIPAGKALAVDRVAFSRHLTEKVLKHPMIRVQTGQILSLDDAALADYHTVVIAAGPLAAESLSLDIANQIGADHCYFYDAIAPIIWTSSLNMGIVFRASRHENNMPPGSGDYLNCPMNRDEYMAFYEALLEGKTMPARSFEKELHFEGCMPLEALAARGPRTLAFGPLKPVGLTDPRTGRRPYAVMQLRAESLNFEACNLVGCQTKLLHSEQRRIFSLVPGLENAEFMRYGSMHRNTFINAPHVLNPDLSLKTRPNFFFAGQICGVEGYVESAASGLWLGHYLTARASKKKFTAPPPTTALGALLAHLQRPVKNFQPANATFGLMPEPSLRLHKKERKSWYAQRARADFAAWSRGSDPPQTGSLQY